MTPHHSTCHVVGIHADWSCVMPSKGVKPACTHKASVTITPPVGHKAIYL